MAITYFVALPFVRTEEGVAPGQAQEMPNEQAAIRRAESMIVTGGRHVKSPSELLAYI
jgi:hypothetical protein